MSSSCLLFGRFPKPLVGASASKYRPRPRLLAVARSSQQLRTAVEAVTPPQISSSKSKDDLKDPARIGATSSSRAPVKDRGGDVSLTAYMTLPLEQYFVLDPSRIVFLGADRFLLKVPRVNLFNLYLEPEVEVSVTTQVQPPRVVLTAHSCRIKGSQGIMDMHLDDRFCLSFVTTLTWTLATAATNGAATLRSSSRHSSSGNSSGSSVSDGFGSSSNGRGQGIDVVRGASSQVAEISGTAQLEVYSEVVQPFHLLPRPALEASCNVVMRGLVNSLLPLFVRQLASDYGRWADDPEYRAQRAARSKPLAQVL